MAAKHEMMGGKLNLYKRERSKYWQCSTFMNGRNWRSSTKEVDLSKAKDYAERWYLTLHDKARHGELRAEKTFAHAAKQFMREYEIITNGQRNARHVEATMGRVKSYLIPYFGKKGLSEVTPGAVQEYRIWRQTYSVPRHH